MYANFEGGVERAPKRKRDFLVKTVQKVLENVLFDPFFSTICLPRKNFCQSRVFLVLLESSDFHLALIFFLCNPVIAINVFPNLERQLPSFSSLIVLFATNFSDELRCSLCICRLERSLFKQFSYTIKSLTIVLRYGVSLVPKQHASL